MASRFNIPAPAVVKLQRDVFEERSYRLKVAVPQGDVETTVEADSLNQIPRKALQCSHGSPYRKPTQVGG